MFKKLALLVLLGGSVAGRLQAQNVVDEIIARVNDSIITRADLERAKQQTVEELKQRFPSDWQARWAEHQKDVLRDLIDEQLLVEKGKDLNITGDTEVVKQLNQKRQEMHLESMEDLEKAAQQQGISFADFKEQLRMNIVREQVLGREVGSRIHITSDEVQKWYREHQKDLEQ